MPPAMLGFRFGVEAELALIRPDGRFADFTNTRFEEVQPFIDALPHDPDPDLRIGDAGIRVKNWYVEGDERFDESGRSTGLAFKGIEIRTAVFPTIGESISSLKTLWSMLERVLKARGWRYGVIGFNPCTRSYRPDYSAWEKEFQASHIAHRLPEISTLSFGPDLNFSRRGDTPEQVLEAVRRLTHYSPYVVPFSFGSPFVGGMLWDGLSYRTYRRTGLRPAALAHLSGRHDHPLVRQADPPSQHLRIEFKAFDMVADDRLLSELFRLILGISIADARHLPEGADLPDQQLHQRVARSGFEDDHVHSEATKILAIARRSLKAAGDDKGFPLLEKMLALRRTPAHPMREYFLQTGEFFTPAAGPSA